MSRKVCADSDCVRDAKSGEDYCAKHNGGVKAVLVPALVCPHCQEKGCVSRREVVRKRGISGAKATGAVITAGISVLATGLSKKEAQAELVCANCGSQWYV